MFKGKVLHKAGGSPVDPTGSLARDLQDSFETGGKSWGWIGGLGGIQRISALKILGLSSAGFI